MKKTERINTMMRYINNRAHFTISEIMTEFAISRSTAIRDIREIEAMGLPLVAEVGRSGGYSVLKNAMLPSVHFTNDEVKALFVAFLATKNQQLPFLKSRQTIAEKLISLLSEVQQDDLVLLNEMLLFQGTNPLNPDLLEMSDLPLPIFEQLIQMLLIDRYLILTIKKEEKIIQYPCYVLHLYQENSRWLMEVFELNTFTKLNVPIMQLEEIEFYNESHAPIEKAIHKMIEQNDPIRNLRLHLGPKALLQYKKYHPYKTKLFYTHPFQTEAICELYVDVSEPGQVEETSQWLLFLGRDVKFLKIPSELRDYLGEALVGFDE